MKVVCEINEVEIEGDHRVVDGVEATCSKCGHTTMSFGTGVASVRRCLALLHSGCPGGESNYYVAEDGWDDD